MTSATPACLIDASIYIFRYYFSMPDNWFSEEEGYGTGAVYGYSLFLLRLLEEHRPSHVAACYDESLGQCFRNQLYPGYKASRALPDEALAFQLHACRRFGELLGIASFASETHEADDLIGTLARVLRRSPRPVAILTRDKDLGQLLRRPQDYLWDHAADLQLYAPDLYAKMGVQPAQLVDYLALVGDSIDDIPGVPGIGAKSAQALLAEYGDLDELFRNLDTLAKLPLRGARGLAAKLEAHREQIEISRQLALIVEDLPLAIKIADLRRGAVNWAGMTEFAREMGFGDRFLTRARKALEPVQTVS
ncbi:5'-3' exonuclease H3TH domain-containing protein [Marinimicrobium sp. ABcell2]|uniref:5'-3' exonuclease n=1 Tax=Marinimicrobium sp. ABcell2 TaxID=3069751 RepID=UPI0027B4DA9F|nr:5'-3' exonuclease H3TH domain-containing protein [Marinimicrobium sp. ABcell2]MDQ2075245.1 5'-3' exonuclease H3TH domain-containing protein [Marinimicrobium sp. ABcell2]